MWRWLKLVGNFFKQNSPTVLTVMTVGGTIMTASLTADAAYKTAPIIEQMKAEEKPGIEIVKKAAPAFIPAGIAILSTIGCIVGARIAGAQQTAAFATLFSGSQLTAQELRKQITDKYGEKAMQELQDAVAQRKMMTEPVTENAIINTGYGDDIFWLLFSNTVFRSTLHEVEKVEITIGKVLQNEMRCTWNDVFGELHLPANVAGRFLGFSSDTGFNWRITYGELPDGRLCRILDTVQDPIDMDSNFGKRRHG